MAKNGNFFHTHINNQRQYWDICSVFSFSIQVLLYQSIWYPFMDPEKSYLICSTLVHDIVEILSIRYKDFVFIHLIKKGMYPWKGRSRPEFIMKH